MPKFAEGGCRRIPEWFGAVFSPYSFGNFFLFIGGWGGQNSHQGVSGHIFIVEPPSSNGILLFPGNDHCEDDEDDEDDNDDQVGGRDAGLYVCQLSTHPPKALHTTLAVRGDDGDHEDYVVGDVRDDHDLEKYMCKVLRRHLFCSDAVMEIEAEPGDLMGGRPPDK